MRGTIVAYIVWMAPKIPLSMETVTSSSFLPSVPCRIAVRRVTQQRSEDVAVEAMNTVRGLPPS